MNAQTEITVDESPVSGLALLREPFPEHAISKLPKPTRKQTEAVRNDFKAGIRCEVCGGWHHPNVVHLDYVGHAALTDRLLSADAEWNWEPVSKAADGVPSLDSNGGMWILLTVCGVTRLGYGHADGKGGGDAIKEVIGDALRNAAMRFGAALDLWHKGDLHGPRDDEPADQEIDQASALKRAIEKAKEDIPKESTIDGLKGLWSSFEDDVRADKDVLKAKDTRKKEIESAPNADLEFDEITF